MLFCIKNKKLKLELDDIFDDILEKEIESIR
jgi:hypothetical protein